MYDTTTWLKAKLQFNDWKKCFQSYDPVKYLVHEDYYFVSSIWDRNNVRYSGIHRLNNFGQIIPKTGINLDNFEWINLMRKSDEIIVALYGDASLKGEKKCMNEVQVHSYKWFLNGEEVKDESANMKYYTEEEALRQSKKPFLKLKTDDVLQKELISGYIQQPSEILIMRMVLHQIVKGCIEVNRHMNCAACQEKTFPELIKHTKPGGCLSDSDFSKCTPFIYNIIEPEDLTRVYNAVCEKMKIPFTVSDVLAKAILAWIPIDEVSKTIDEEEKMFTDAFTEDTNKGYTTKYEECQNPIIAPMNWPLRYLICKTYFDLNMRAVFRNKLRVRSYGR